MLRQPIGRGGGSIARLDYFGEGQIAMINTLEEWLEREHDDDELERIYKRFRHAAQAGGDTKAFRSIAEHYPEHGELIDHVLVALCGRSLWGLIDWFGPP
jgi:hypothetical protein